MKGPAVELIKQAGFNVKRSAEPEGHSTRAPARAERIARRKVRELSHTEVAHQSGSGPSFAPPSSIHHDGPDGDQMRVDCVGPLGNWIPALRHEGESRLQLVVITARRLTGPRDRFRSRLGYSYRLSLVRNNKTAFLASHHTYLYAPTN